MKWSLLLLPVLLAGCATPRLSQDERRQLETGLVAVTPADQAAWDGQPVVRVDAEYTPGQVTGSVTIDWINTTGSAVDDVVLTTYANQPSYHGATMTVATAQVDGQPVTPQVVANGLGVRLPLARPLAPRDRVVVRCTFTHQLSTEGGYHGLAQLNEDGVAVLHGWYPDLALRSEGRWQTDPLPELCDPARSWLAHVIARLRLPDGRPFPTGGKVVAVVDDPGPTRHLTIVSPFTRNLTLVMGGTWHVDEVVQDGVRIRAWTQGDAADNGPKLLAATAAAAARCSAAFAPYPYAELDAVAAPLGPSVGGVESTGLYLIEADACEDSSRSAIINLEKIAAHETAHSWWYQVVGNDPLRCPWLDESLTNWTTLWLVAQRSPTLGRGFARELSMESSFGLDDGRFPPLDPPLWESGDLVYGAQTYGRGAVAYAALRKEVGDERFFACLRAWATAQRWRVATPADWKAHLTTTLGAEVTDRFWDRWIFGHGLTMPMVVEALQGK